MNGHAWFLLHGLRGVVRNGVGAKILNTNICLNRDSNPCNATSRQVHERLWKIMIHVLCNLDELHTGKWTYNIRESAKSKKYLGTFKVESREKIRYVRENLICLNNWSISKSQKGLLACYTLWNTPWKPFVLWWRYKAGMKAWHLWKSLNGIEVIVVGRGWEFHLTFVRWTPHFAA